MKRLVFLVLLLSLWLASPAWAQVAKNSGDGGTAVGCTAFNSGATSLSYSGYTVASGTSVVLVGMVAYANGTPNDITGTPTLTWHGASMTRIGTGVYNGSRTEIFALASPDAGNFAAAAAWGVGHDACIFLISFTGAGTVDTATTATGTGIAASVTESSDTSGATVAITGASSNVSATVLGTQIGMNNSTWASSAASYTIGGTSNVHSWTIDSSVTWEAIAAHVHAASAGASFSDKTGLLGVIKP